MGLSNDKDANQQIWAEREVAVVIGFGRKVLHTIWEYPVPSLVTAVLLGLIGLGGMLTGRFIWGWYQLEKAQRAIDQRDFAQALTHLERCLEVRNGSAETHFLAARTARRAGNLDLAEAHLKTSRQLGEIPERINLERTLLRVQQGELSPATQEKLRALVEQEHPDSSLILECLAKYFIRTYQMTQALGYLNFWLEREPDNIQALLWRAEVHGRQLAPVEALEDYRHIVALDPGHDEARQHLAEGLVTAHQPEAALPHLEYVLERQPDSPALLLAMARCRHLLNQQEEAKKLLDHLLSLTPADPAALSERGRLALAMGQPAEAEEWLRKAWKLAPYERETNYSLYLALTQLGKTAEAAEIFAALEKIDKDLGRLKELTRAISQAPHDPALRHEAGMIFLNNGQPKEGLRWLQSALQEDPRYQPTHLELIKYYDSIGDRAQAAEHRRWTTLGLRQP
jgi:predicted Zn-dependent protease